MSSELCFHNTLTRKKEAFIPMHGKKVSMFVCGQTVYDDAHLGHARNYIAFDIIARWLRHKGYELTYIQNITDVDDKIISRAKENGESPSALSSRYEERFMQDMERIGVKKNVDAYPRSHDYIKEIAAQIQQLLDNGNAYASEGDVYFEVDSFDDYTKLSGMKLEELTKHRIEAGQGKKKQYDFAVWKRSKEGEPSWEITLMINGSASLFNGRPGWHIEDTAITNSFFGPQYDIHGGATELIFPHHSNEIAQAEAASGLKPFVKYWLHTGVLNISGEKMSKSLKNFITIQKILEKYEPDSLRLMVASSSYRSQIDFTEDLIKTSADKIRFMNSSLNLFCNFKALSGDDDSLLNEAVDAAYSEFGKAMDDDIDTPRALAALWSGILTIRKLAEGGKSLSAAAKSHALERITTLAGILGILESKKYLKTIPEGVMAKIQKRDELRRKGEFKEADSIRKAVYEEHKISLEDTKYGTVWYSAE